MIDKFVWGMMNEPLKKPVKTACAHCGKMFKRTLPSYAQMFCSDDCKCQEEVEIATMLLMSNHPLSEREAFFCERILGV